MITAVILAGGTSKRFGSPIPKQFLEINAKPMIQYTIDAFNGSTIDRLLIVLPKEWMKFKLDITKPYKIIPGGETRLESIKNAMLHVSTEEVIIHDGDRPNLTYGDIDNLISDFHKSLLDGGIYAISTYDSILTKDLKFADRDNIVHVQTPTIWKTEIVKDLLLDIDPKWNNIWELFIAKYPDKLIFVKRGSPRFQKITIPEDLIIFKQIVNGR